MQRVCAAGRHASAAWAVRCAAPLALRPAAPRGPSAGGAAAVASAPGRCFSSTERPDRANRQQAWRRRVVQLQRTYSADPSNQQKLVDLMRALNHLDPQQAIRLFEKQEPRVAFGHDGCVREYLRALTLTNRLDYVDLDQVLRRNWGDFARDVLRSPGMGQGAASGSSALPVTSIELRLPSNSDPLKVQVTDSNPRAAWRLLRFFLTFVLMLGAASVFAEGLAGNVQKGFGMSSKTIQPVEDVTTSFDDVKGCDEVKEELQEIILYLKDPDRFTRLGAKLPKGLMMSGPPGTGKTLLARAIAGEAGVPFLQASGSEFEEMFVGVGARRVRDLFQEARKHAPCIVFIDEIDAVGSKRSSRDNTAVRMTLNQLLVELDGFEQNNGIVVICATNLPESLDKALTRPGRLDKMVVVPVPDLRGRIEILELYAKKMVLDKGVNLHTVARRTAGMTGADLFNILNIAAVRSSAEGLAAIPQKYLEQAFDRVVVGLERRNPMSEQEKRLTAYHEGGHTLVSIGCIGADPVHKATIMPRGNALGITWSIPEREKYSERLFELQARLEVLMGGKAAEELIFGQKNVTAGCTSDLRQATGLARRMVMNFGMPSDDGTPGTLYMEVDDYAVLSDEAKGRIDGHTQMLLTNAYTRAMTHLKSHEAELHNLAKALIEYETLSAEEITLAIKGDMAVIAERRAVEEARVREPLVPRDLPQEASKKDAKAGRIRDTPRERVGGGSSQAAAGGGATPNGE